MTKTKTASQPAAPETKPSKMGVILKSKALKARAEKVRT